MHIVVIAESSFLLPASSASPWLPFSLSKLCFGGGGAHTLGWILEFGCTLGIVGNSFIKLCSDVPIAVSIAA